MKFSVYHGTHRIFAEAIREHGIPAIPDEVLEQGFEIRPTEGIRVRLDPFAAFTDARAWTAYMIVSRMKAPQGMIVTAEIEDARIRLDRHGTPRVDRLEPSEVVLRGPIEFPEFGAVMLNGRRSASLSDARAAIDAALKDFERLTDRRVNSPFPRQRTRRS